MRRLVTSLALSAALAFAIAPAPARADVLGSVSGTVTQASGGQAIAGAVVYLSDQLGYGSTISATTGADGSYTFATVPTGQYYLVVLAHGFVQRYPRYEQLSVATGQSETGVDVALDPAGYITGKITDSTGKPMVGVKIIAISDTMQAVFVQLESILGYASLTTITAENAWILPDVITGRTENSPGFGVTAADGTYTLDGLTEGNYSLGFEADGHWGVKPKHVVLPTATSSLVLNATLPAGNTVTGLVRRPDGTPEVGVTVTISDSSNWGGVSPLAGPVFDMFTSQAVTGADGRYSFDGVPATTVYATIVGNTVPTFQEQFDVTSGGTTSHDLVLPGNGTISGTVRDASNVAVANSYLLINGTDTYTWTYVSSDVTGHWSIDGVPNDTYSVQSLYAPGFLPSTQPTSLTVSDTTPSPTADVPLTLGGTVSGVVKDPDGQPVGGALVLLTPTTGTNALYPQTAVTYADGTYSFTGLDLRSYTLTAEASDLAAPAAQSLDITASGDVVSRDFALLPLSAATVPSSPPLSADGALSESAYLRTTTVIPDGGNPTTGYQAIVSPGNKTCSLGLSGCSITGLAGGVTYTAKLRVRNQKGWGPYATKKFTTLKYASYAKESSKALSHGRALITLVKPPKQQWPVTATIVDYKLELYIKGHWTVYKHTRNKALKFIVSKLRVKTSYAARVTPVMSKGVATTSKTFTIKTG
jgi:hypothetical protein